jgi:hypothetical protein
MKYIDGKEVLLGDRIQLWDGLAGTVVCLLEERRSIPDFNFAEWAYLAKGIVVETDEAGLVHYEEQSGPITKTA